MDCPVAVRMAFLLSIQVVKDHWSWSICMMCMLDLGRQPNSNAESLESHNRTSLGRHSLSS